MNYEDLFAKYVSFIYQLSDSGTKNQETYQNVAQDYDDLVMKTGYTAPEIMAQMYMKHAANEENDLVLDVGAGILR